MSEPTLLPEDARGVICENLADLSSISLNVEVEEDELAIRYGGSSSGQDESDSGIQIFRPDDSEIVARYAANTFKDEPEPDEEIILNHPDDDDVVKRYASCFLSDNEEGTEYPEAVTPVVLNDDDTCNATVASSSGSRIPSPPRNETISPDDEDMSDLDPPVLQNEAARGANPTSESFSDMSDLERIQPVSPSQLSLDEDSESLDGLRDAELADPTSSHNRSITFYNLCCNKEIFSSISIDSPVKEAVRGLSHRRSIMRNGNLDTFQSSGDCGRYLSRKPRNRSRSKVVSRNDNLVCVIHKLERIAQTMEAKCIEAGRSLRRNCSQANSARTGAKLNSDLTPLLNFSVSLLRKVRTNVP